MLHLIMILATGIAGLLAALYFAGPAILSALGVMGGTYLRKKTEGRRAHLLEVMAQEEKAFQEKESSAGRPSTDSNGWENVEASSEKSGGSTGKQQTDSSKDWSGIVGFFHPFW